jgi:hypothetical protein
MPNNLGKVMRCESRVNTRLRYVQKSVENCGSPSRVEIKLILCEQRTFVTNVTIDLNAPNGVFKKNDTVSGVDLRQFREKLYVVNET